MAEILITPGARASLLRDAPLYGTGAILGGSVDEITMDATGLGGRAGDSVIVVSDPAVQSTGNFPGRSFVQVTGAKNPGDTYWIDADAVGAAVATSPSPSPSPIVAFAVVAVLGLILATELS